MSKATIESLSEQVRGEIITENDDRYEEARRVFNGMIGKRPKAIVRPSDRADVISVVRFAGETGADLSIRGGSHSVPGFGTNDGCAVHEVEAGSTAFGNRDANFSTVIAGIWPEPKDNEANIEWVRDYYAATAPFSREGGYINFQSADDSDNAEKNYGATYARLADIKKKYAPDNLFRMSQNIPPAG